MFLSSRPVEDISQFQVRRDLIKESPILKRSHYWHTIAEQAGAYVKGMGNTVNGGGHRTINVVDPAVAAAW
jgi:hypothetical protein